MRRLALLLLFIALAAQAEPVRVAVLMHAADGSAEDSSLRAALDEAQGVDPAFIVVNGIKNAKEPCTDRLYRQRKALLESAASPVFLSMAGSDWLACRDRHGRPASAAWLNLLREQLFGDISWNGSKHLALRRQSALPAYRSYAENTRWTVQGVLFATLHLPAPNNHYLASAGQNSEFEDRLTANRDWLRRIALAAKVERRKAIVIFCDGNPLPSSMARGGQRDGYDEIRKALRAMAAKAKVPVLVVQGPLPVTGTAIVTQGLLSAVNLKRGMNEIAIDPEADAPFALPDAVQGAAQR